MMATKADAPKLSPAERLARKRAAARLRQQRCRARKRQAMLAKKRGEIVEQRDIDSTHDARRTPGAMPAVQHRPQSLFPTYTTIHSSEASSDSWASVRGERPSHRQLNKPGSEIIYNCISFDSQKSFEEAQQQFSRSPSSPPRSPTTKSPTVITSRQTPPPGDQAALVKDTPEPKVEESLVPEEEAAVAAMLSLKSGSTNKPGKDRNERKQSPPRSPPRPSPPPREVIISRKATTHSCSGPRRIHSEQMYHDQHKHINVRSQHQRHSVPRRYEAYNYGHPMKIPLHSRRTHAPPGYYRVHAPLPPPHPHYSICYYPPAPRYISYEYE
mmetsp:Transcript_21916/g.52155  ORF Transcript_21916/g.52155 Transcript_21916/m.52155 type:complete len:327 (-) Transcript_21916:35-1015(-)